MAARLKRMSGIDPLTIDVTEFRPPGERAVVCDVSGPAKRRFKTDMAIALPTPRIVRGRMDWRLRRGYGHVDVPAGARDPNAWTIVEARYASEPDDAAPADRVLAGPGEDVPLLLKPGRYRVEGWTRESGWREAMPITVR